MALTDGRNIAIMEIGFVMRCQERQGMSLKSGFAMPSNEFLAILSSIQTSSTIPEMQKGIALDFVERVDVDHLPLPEFDNDPRSSSTTFKWLFGDELLTVSVNGYKFVGEVQKGIESTYLNTQHDVIQWLRSHQ